MKLTTFLFALFCFFSGTQAQTKVVVEGTYPNIFIKHKIFAGETLYSISKLYNLTVEQVAKINGINETAILAIGKVMKIPVESKNFTQDGQSAETETLVPLHHLVKKSDNLFRISQTYGKLRLDFLKEWNDMNSDIIQDGQKLVIGHLKVDKKRYAEIISRTTAADNEQEESGYVISPEKKGTNNTEPITPTKPVTNGDDDEGFFTQQFTTKGKVTNKNGESATFKTTSGWTDRKYYVLMNNVTPGTIVRLTANNGRSACAKVLGALPEMKENRNLLLRISNATSSLLKITDSKFVLSVTYYD